MDINTIMLDNNYNVVERVQKKKRSSNSKRIMLNLRTLLEQKEAMKKLEYPLEIESHKVMMIYQNFFLGKRKTGSLYIIAHLRHLVGFPRYWDFEFRFRGSMKHLTLYDYTLCKLAYKCNFCSNGDDFNMPVQDRYKYIISNLSILVDRLKDFSHEKLRTWFSDDIKLQRLNPYRREYKKLTRATSPRSKPYITIIDE